MGYSGARLEGRGIICNLSSSGARISEITESVPNGVQLRLELGMLSGLPSFSMAAEVVRQTEGGFAVRFLETPTPDARVPRPVLELIGKGALWEKRGRPRYGAGIPAVMESERQFLTGVVENLSATGALLTNPTGSLEVGARGYIKLTNLGETLRTVTESVRLQAEIVGKQPGGFRIRFLGDQDELDRLLQRAFGRHAIEPS